MPRPRKPKLTPVYRVDGDRERLIPGPELARQVREMERMGTWALAQGLAIAEGLHEDVENPMVNEKRMGRYFAIAGACLGAINGRVNAFRFLQEVDRGEHAGGNADQYSAADRRGGPAAFQDQ